MTATPRRTLRVPDEEWDAWVKESERRGYSTTELVREAVRAYIEHGVVKEDERAVMTAEAEPVMTAPSRKPLKYDPLTMEDEPLLLHRPSLPRPTEEVELPREVEEEPEDWRDQPCPSCGVLMGEHTDAEISKCVEAHRVMTGKDEPTCPF